MKKDTLAACPKCGEVYKYDSLRNLLKKKEENKYLFDLCPKCGG